MLISSCFNYFLAVEPFNSYLRLFRLCLFSIFVFTTYLLSFRLPLCKVINRPPLAVASRFKTSI